MSVSELNKLIDELCPKGVAYASLGQLEDEGRIKLGRGMIISKNALADFPGDYPVYSSSAVGTGEFGRYGKYMFDDERITWSVDGGGRFFYRPTHKYSVTNVSGWLKVNDEEIATKYLFYALDNVWLTKSYDYTKKAHPSVIRNEYTIPVPPLSVQRKIVQILDSFVELTVNLETELSVRMKQYEYYRSHLLRVDSKVRFVKLGDVAEIGTGSRNGNEAVVGGKYPLYVRSQEVKSINTYAYDEEAIIIPGEGGVGDIFHYVEGKYDLHQRAYRIHLTDHQLDAKYVYYYMRSFFKRFIKTRAVNATVSSIRKPMLLEFTIPVVPLSEQLSAVEVLDKFDRLIDDTIDGIPAELAARRKQYEYYRNKLLTFKELGA